MHRLIAVTLVTGLLPVVANLISYAVIVIVSLSYSMHAAIAWRGLSLPFLAPPAVTIPLGLFSPGLS
jgi:hypothetical protein